ncbi:MAG: hypothetical protein GKS05_01290 [Nitrospirales bacterium]|nr:hypothetical protein [Nitrospirales bacterium]
MTNPKKMYTGRILQVLLLSTLVGCAETAPTKFYLLNSLASPSNNVASSVESVTPVVGVGPIDFPDYLDRPQIMSRIGPNELTIQEFQRWAEPLKDNFSNVLAENLSILLQTNQVEVHPWRGVQPRDYQIQITVTRFDSDLSGRTFLSARWKILSNEKEPVLVVRQVQLIQESVSQDFADVIAAMSQNVADLSREIADALKVLPLNRVPPSAM